MAITAGNDIAGYECDLVDPLPDRLLCNICHLPSRDPYLSVCCGHLFCRICLENFGRFATAGNVCPVCRCEDFFAFPNKAVDREIRSLRVHCTNKVMGCEWKGELNDINGHLENNDGCRFEVVDCPNECGKMMQRQRLTSHIEVSCKRREVNCQYCHRPGEYQIVMGQHKSQCPKFPLLCPNKCEVGTILREDMKKHRAKCWLEIISCPNHCGDKLERQFLADHIQIKCPRRKVNCQYCHDIGEHQFIEGQHKEECPKLPLPCPNKCKIGSVPRQNMKAHRIECPLEVIRCEYYSVGCEVRMARKDQEKHRIENVEQHLMKTNFAVRGDINETKLELTSTKQDLIDATVALADAKCKLADTTNHLAIALQRISSLESSVYLATNIVTRTTSSAAVMESSLGWSTKLAAMAMMSKSGDQVCPVTLKMSGFDKMKKNNLALWSDFFYTTYRGYRMHMLIVPSSRHLDSGTYLSCYLYLTKGPHDENLTWPFKENFEIKLLNQIGDNQHHSTFVTYCSIVIDDSTGRSTVRKGSKTSRGWGKFRFISSEHLHKTTTTCQFIKNDCLFFQITKL